MTEGKIPSKVLVQICDGNCEQDVAQDPKHSIFTAMIDMVQSVVKEYTRTNLVIMNMDNLIDDEGICRCYPSAACENWELDLGFLQERWFGTDIILDDLDGVVLYLNAIMKDGPIGSHCLWNDCGKCLYKECNSQ